MFPVNLRHQRNTQRSQWPPRWPSSGGCTGKFDRGCKVILFNVALIEELFRYFNLSNLVLSQCSKYQTLGDMMKQEKFEEAPLADEGREGYLDAILEGTAST